MSLARVQQDRVKATSLGLHQFSASVFLVLGWHHEGLMFMSSYDGTLSECGQSFLFGASHFRVLTDRASFDRVLAPCAETCLVRSQKKRHGCDFLNRTHAIEG